MAEPRVSVVLTTYNQEAYVRRAMESVLEQTLPVHELIVCDDASTDGTRTIIEEVRARRPDVVRPVLQPENVGVAANRNAGLRGAAGDYVTLLSGDDWFYPEKVAREVAALEASPEAGWAYAGVMAVDAAGRPTGEFGAPEEPEGRIFEDVVLRRVSPRYMMMRAEALRSCGLADESLPLYEDWDFKIRLSHRYDAVRVPEVLSAYRVHDEGLHRTTRTVHIEAMAAVVERALELARGGDPASFRRLEAGTRDILLERWVRYGALEGERGRAWRKLAPRLARRPLRPFHLRLATMLLLPRPAHRALGRLRRAVKRRLVARRSAR